MTFESAVYLWEAFFNGKFYEHFLCYCIYVKHYAFQTKGSKMC
jgi:hypothetical protein